VQCGIHTTVIPDKYTVPALVAAVVKYFEAHRTTDLEARATL